MMDRVLNELYQEVAIKCADHPRWVTIFKNCFSNTLEQALLPMTEGGFFVLTGDIPAMWLRDSTAQVRPYILLANQSETMMNLLLGVIRTQVSCILHDAYANAFNQCGDGAGHAATDTTDMSPFIWERKYEVDSLCYPMQLAYLLYRNTGQTSHFNRDFYSAMRRVAEVWRLEQNHNQSDYRFVRQTNRQWDTLVNDGHGPEHAYTGMTWSGFRPSDDHCRFSYLVPSNMFAVVVLGYMAEISQTVYKDTKLAAELTELQHSIDEGIRRFGITEVDGQPVYAYETDGLGHYNIMDDGNIPNLLSIPYLGYSADKQVYENTKKVIFSPKNPWYYEGKCARGIGSSHTWENYIWPLSLAMEGLITDNREEKARVLNVLADTDGGTGFMHESFDVDDPTNYTREWFSWPNMLFCELLLSYIGYELKK